MSFPRINKAEWEKFIAIRKCGKLGSFVSGDDIDFLTSMRNSYPASLEVIEDFIVEWGASRVNPFIAVPEDPIYPGDCNED